MVHIVAPEIAPGIDAQALEGGVHVAQVGKAIFPGTLADAEAERAVAIEVDVGMVCRQIMEHLDHIVHVEVLVHPVAEEEARAIDAGERDAALEEVRTAQCRDSGVGGTHGAAGCKWAEVGAVPVMDIRDKLVRHEAEVALLALGTPALVAVRVRPGFLVDGVDAEQLHLSTIDVVGKLGDHAEVLVVRALRVLGLENDDGVSRHAVHDHAEIFAEHIAVVGNCIAVHEASSDSTSNAAHGSSTNAWKPCLCTSHNNKFIN